MTHCPFHHAESLPDDSAPTLPSPDFARWRDEADMVPLTYQDGHEGWLVTHDDLARQILTDSRFSQQPQRLPVNRAPIAAHVVPGGLDDEAEEASRVANILGMDGAAHMRLRRAITRRFSVRSARSHAAQIAEIVAEELAALLAAGSPADLTAIYAEPISARVHCLVLGIGEQLVPRFVAMFVHGAPRQQQYDFLREAIQHRREHPGEDVITDMLASDLSEAETLGLTLTLALSGRDTVAYFIATATVALLTNPEQWQILRSDPALIPAALEEFVRFGTMFLTLFPRTATEDVQIGACHISAGTTVSVSAVSANRDEGRWGPTASELDVTRDARGHLGFGDGPHMCVGQQLARVELAEAMRQLLEALPSMRLVHADQLTPQPLANPIATYAAGRVLIEW